MKRKVILASHGGLAAGLLDTAQMILGGIEYETQVFSLQPGHHPDEFARQIGGEIERDVKKETEFIILCDLLGASVCTAFYPLMSHENVKLFTGMNLNMLLAVCLECTGPLGVTETKRIVDAGRNGICLADAAESESEDF